MAGKRVSLVESLLCRQEGLNLDSRQPSTSVCISNPSARGWSQVDTCVYSAGQSNLIREFQLSQKLGWRKRAGIALRPPLVHPHMHPHTCTHAEYCHGLGAVARAWNPSILKMRQRVGEFEASLGWVRPCFKWANQRRLWELKIWAQWLRAFAVPLWEPGARISALAHQA